MEEVKIKRVLILIDTNVGGKGGAEMHLWNLLANIDQSRVSVDVIYFNADDMDAKISHGRIQGINYFRVPLRKIFSFSSIRYLNEIYKIMRKGNYSCVISFFESSDIVAAKLGMLAGIKMRISNRRDTGFRNSKKLELLYGFINKFFTGFIAVSEAVKESIIAQGISSEKIQVVYNSVDLSRFQKVSGSDVRRERGIQSDEIVFGMLANLNPVKNHVSVINALKILHEEDYKSHLILAGEGVLRNELEQQVSDLNLEPYVHFLGSRDDVEKVLASMDVFILASHTEGLSNALLEAMASRKAVIASRVGGNVEVVKDGVDGLLTSTEAISIAKAMKKLYVSKELRDEMADNAFNRVARQFSLEQMLDKYMSIIEQTVDNAGSKGQAA